MRWNRDFPIIITLVPGNWLQFPEGNVRTNFRDNGMSMWLFLLAWGGEEEEEGLRSCFHIYFDGAPRVHTCNVHTESVVSFSFSLTSRINRASFIYSFSLACYPAAAFEFIPCASVICYAVVQRLATLVEGGSEGRHVSHKSGPSHAIIEYTQLLLGMQPARREIFHKQTHILSFRFFFLVLTIGYSICFPLSHNTTIIT